MKNKYKKIYLIIMFIIISIFPKINIINISNSRTGIRLEDIFVLIYFLSLFLDIIKNGFEKYSSIVKYLILFGIYFIICFISNIFGVMNGYVSFILSMLHLVRKFEYFILIFAGYDLFCLLKNKNNINKIVKGILLFHTIFIIFSKLGVIGDISNLIGRVANDRTYSTFSGPYELGGYLLLCLPFTINMFIEDKKNIFYILICLMGIILSESRISLIAFIFIILIYLYIYFIRDKLYLKILAPIISIIIVVFCIINPLNIKQFDRFSDIDFSSVPNTIKAAWEYSDFDYYMEHNNIRYDKRIYKKTSDLSFAIRMNKWITIAKEATKHPFFGLGLSIVGEGMDGSFARLLCESGVLGFASWCIIIVSLIIDTIKSRLNLNYKVVSYSMISSIIIGSIFIDIFEASKIMMTFWFLIGFIFNEKNKKIRNKNSKIKVIHIVPGINNGGIESMLYNYYSNYKINKFENIIISHSINDKSNELKFKKLRFKVYQVTPKRKNIIKNIKQIKSIIYNENPDIVHVHMAKSSYISLIISYFCGVNIRICHTHVCEKNNSVISKICVLLCNIFASHYFACSSKAAKILYYKNNYKNCIIINNAIDLDKFNYNTIIRNKLRQRYNLKSSDILIGYFGRLSSEKNPFKAISIFNKLKKLNNNYKLLIIGDGYLKEDILNKISKDILYISSTDEINNYYQMIDILLNTSSNEGFGMVILEAQISGLNCLVSKNVPKEINITNNVRFISINEKDDIWCDNIIKMDIEHRKSCINNFVETKYDIKYESSKLFEYYLKFIEEIKE